MQLPTNPGRNTNPPLLRVELEHEQGHDRGDWLARNTVPALATAVLVLLLVAVLIALFT